nr:32 kDa non-structural protein [Bovine coronavirus]
MAVAYADKPNHFINFPLTQFEGFVLNYKGLQFQLLDEGVDCKIQTAPHISLAMLDIQPEDYRSVDVAIQEVIDDMHWGEGFQIKFDNPHILGRCIVLDVKGVEELHDDLVNYIRDKGCVADQSRKWIGHCTIAQLTDAALSIKENVDFINSMQFNYKITINPSSPARLEIVKLGAEKKDGFYETIVSHWMGIRFEYNPPTDKLAMIMGYCCLEVVRKELEEGDLPENDDDAWFKLSYHYENNSWFFRHVYRKSSYFRKSCQNLDCNCLGFYESSVEED